MGKVGAREACSRLGRDYQTRKTNPAVLSLDFFTKVTFCFTLQHRHHYSYLSEEFGSVRIVVVVVVVEKTKNNKGQ